MEYHAFFALAVAFFVLFSAPLHPVLAASIASACLRFGAAVFFRPDRRRREYANYGDTDRLFIGVQTAALQRALRLREYVDTLPPSELLQQNRDKTLQC